MGKAPAMVSDQTNNNAKRESKRVILRIFTYLFLFF